MKEEDREFLTLTGEDGDEYIEPIEDDKEFEEISETFEDRLSEIYDFE